MSRPQCCQACGRPLRRLRVYVTVGTTERGPFGATCARLVVDAAAGRGVTATREYARAGA